MFPPPPPFPAPAASQALAVSALNRLVRECLEQAFPLLWVSGEISNLTYAASGHVYFSLKDAQAQVRCVMWRSRAQTLGWRLENGQKIEARALVSFYEPRGEFQLNVEQIRRAGQGDLYERFLRLKTQLENEGIFAVDRKRPLPAFPQHLAIVTSPQAAALRDVLSTLHRRAPQMRITLIPTPVQGEGAAERIAAALGEVGKLTGEGGPELVILCRGGGSIEDLWSFNEEVVARAIRACALPVISGVGHETDFTIADFAADLRAPTPTAAAELAVPERSALLARLDALASRLRRDTERRQSDRQQRLDWLAARLLHPAERLRRHGADLDNLRRRLTGALNRRASEAQRQLAQGRLRLQALRPRPEKQKEIVLRLAHRLNQPALRLVSRHAARLESLAGSLKQLDPKAVLGRGYALVTGDDGRIVRDASVIAPGSSLGIEFARGRAQATVDRVVAPGEAE